MKTQVKLSCLMRGCKIHFARQQELIEHLEAFHQKKFTCPYPGCSYRGATRVTNRKKHMKDKHREVSKDCHNESYINETSGNVMSLQPPAHYRSTNELHSFAGSAHPQQQINATTEPFLPSVCETTYLTLHASSRGPRPAIGSSNSIQVEWSGHKPQLHPPMDIPAEESAAISGLTAYDYTSTLGEFMGDFTGSIDYDNGDVYSKGNQFGGFGNIEGGANYSWSG